jgi:hypothetical protein
VDGSCAGSFDGAADAWRFPFELCCHHALRNVDKRTENDGDGGGGDGARGEGIWIGDFFKRVSEAYSK